MKHSITLSAIFAAALLAGCQKSALETAYATQGEAIENYVASQLSAHESYRAEYRDGVVRLVVLEGQGAPLERGGSVTMNYSGFDFSRSSMSASTLFVTTDSDVASAYGWSLSDESVFAPVTIVLGKDRLVRGLEIGLEGVCSGEECYIIFTGKYGFKKQIGTIPANAPLCYHIYVEDVAN